MATDLTGLKNFEKKIAKYSNSSNNNIYKEVGKAGVEIAREEYGKHKVELAFEVLGNGVVRITATRKGLAYLEYGTGLVGKGTYKGSLPTQTLTFESPKNSGDYHTTQGWEYFYDNPKTKDRGGWWINEKVFTRGRVAGNQMFNTADRLNKELPKIVKGIIKKGVKR